MPFHAISCPLRPKFGGQKYISTEHTWNERLTAKLHLSRTSKLDADVEKIRRPISRVLCRPACAERDGHSSGPALAGRFSRPTRSPQAGDGPTLLPRRGIPIRSCSWRGLPCGPCHQAPGALLPHPFTLTAPRPQGAKAGGLLSVALSLGLPPVGVTHRHVVVEPGLSSTPLRRPRPPSRLIRADHDREARQRQARRRMRSATGSPPSPSIAPARSASLLF